MGVKPSEMSGSTDQDAALFSTGCRLNHFADRSLFHRALAEERHEAPLVSQAKIDRIARCLIADRRASLREEVKAMPSGRARSFEARRVTQNARQPTEPGTTGGQALTRRKASGRLVEALGTSASARGDAYLDRRQLRGGGYYRLTPCSKDINTTARAIRGLS